VGAKPHPARFPEKLPTFFIEFLTDPGDTVLDTFAGSNTTGSAADKLDRRWMAFEKDRTYLAASAFRFVDELPTEELTTLWSRLQSDELPVEARLAHEASKAREVLELDKANALRWFSKPISSWKSGKVALARLGACPRQCMKRLTPRRRNMAKTQAALRWRTRLRSSSALTSRRWCRPASTPQ
jgi:hypothetical protein